MKMEERELEERTSSHLEQNKSAQCWKYLEGKHTNFPSLSFPFLPKSLSKHNVQESPK